MFQELEITYLKRLRMILKSNIKWILVLVLAYSFVFNNIYTYKSKYNGNEKIIRGYVLEKKISNNKLVLVVKGKEKIIVKSDKKIDVNYHDQVLVRGYLKEPKNNTIFNLFNYKKYLNRKKICYILKTNNIRIIKKNKNIIFSIKNYLYNRIEKYRTKKYLKIFILGNKDELDYEEKNLYKNLGIIHLLSISGSYISIMLLVLNKLLNKKLIMIFLIFYIVLTGFQISIIRSCSCYLLFILNSKYDLKFNSKEIIMLLGTILLLINPFYLYDIGFLLSFIVSYSLMFFYDLFENKNYIYKSLLISIVSFLSSLPIIVNTNYSINLLSVVYNLFYIPYSVFILYPLSYITFFYPFLDNLYMLFINIFEHVSLYLNNINILTFSVSRIPMFLILIYYYLLFSRNRKIIIMLIIFNFYNYFCFIPKVYFLDVGQGDTSLIRLKNKTLLIDTGGLYNYSNYNNLIMFFRSIGTKKIDYMLISHGDFDHMGEAINLVNNFKVEKVIFNCGEFNDLEKELIKVLDKKKIKYYSCIKELNIDSNKLYFLQTKEYDNENDNSNVIYIEFDGYKFMFMGDAGIDKEKDILEKYNISDIDVLKVGHHGSRTSSGKEFINIINPKYSIISVGKNNRYGHPNKEVLNNLENSKIYRTDQDGSIMFKIKNNKLKIETCSP